MQKRWEKVNFQNPLLILTIRGHYLLNFDVIEISQGFCSNSDEALSSCLFTFWYSATTQGCQMW